MTDWPHEDDGLGIEPGAVELGHRLRTERPVPRAAFRSAARRRLSELGAPRGRPQRFWLRVAGLTGSGAGLLLAGGLVGLS